MAKYSTGLRNGMLNASGFKELMDGGRLRVYSGTPPATADAAATGTLLAELTGAGDGTTGLTFATPANGAISKTSGQVWREDAILATNTAGYFRLVAAGDTAAASTTQPRVQGTVGLGGTDLVVVSTAFVTGEAWTLEYFNLALPTD